MDTFWKSPVTTNTQRTIANVTNERRISLDIMAETIKVFKGFTVWSTINDSSNYNSEEDDAEINPKSDKLVTTHTSDGKKIKLTDTGTTNWNSPRKLLINPFIPEIIPVIVLPIDLTTAHGVAASGGTLHACHTILLKEIVTDAACSAEHVFKYPTVVNWKDIGGSIPWEGKTSGTPLRFNTPVRIGDGPSVSPTRIEIQKIVSPSRYIGTQEVRNTQPFDTSSNGISDKHRDSAPTFSKAIGRKFSDKSSVNVYLRFWVNLTRDAVLAKSPNLMNLGTFYVHTPMDSGPSSSPLP